MAGATRCSDRTVKVRLRPVLGSDSRWLDGWLPPVAEAAGYPAGTIRGERADAAAARKVWIIEAGGEDAGVVACRIHTPERESALIEIVATRPESARRGAGLAAAVALEAELRRIGTRQVYAPAPAPHGIALYFWIRLGYRPLLRPQWPACASEETAWLVREL